MKVGDSAEVTRAFTDADVRRYGELADAPVDAGRVPEPLIGALFSYLLGMHLPGLGTNYLKQQTEFLAGAPIGKPLIASVQITRLRPEKHLVDLETNCRLEDGTPVASGRALVYVRDVE